MSSSLRADLLLMFAECFFAPQHEPLVGLPLWMAAPGCEWPLYVGASCLADELRSAKSAIPALSAIPAETIEKRQARYEALFVGINSAPRHWLYESAARTGRIIGSQTFELAQLYSAAGLESELGAELPDHASLELAFLAHLNKQSETDSEHTREWRSLERQFIKEHDDWLIELGRALSSSGDQVYAPVGAFLADFLVESGQADPGDNKTSFKAPYDSTKVSLCFPTITNSVDCNLCGFCVQVCPRRALKILDDRENTLLVLNPAECTYCGKCERTCEFRALKMLPADAAGSCQYASVGFSGWEVLRISRLEHCRICSQPVASQAEMDYIAAQVGEADWQHLCLDCRSSIRRSRCLPRL